MISAKVTRKSLIKKYPQKLDKVNKMFLPAAGAMVQGEAKRNLRANDSVRTGRLRGSIASIVKSDNVVVGTNVEYAPYVEYGTVRSRAKPYLRPALDVHKKNLVRMWKDIFRRVYGR